MDTHQKAPNMTEAHQLTREDSMNVYDGGRFTIPYHVRERYDLFPGRLVDVVLLLDGEEEHFSRALDSGNQVTIPARIRREHDITDGDRVDVKVGVADA